MSRFLRLTHSMFRLLLLLLCTGFWPAGAEADSHDLAPASEYWVDFTGMADIQAVSRLRPEELLPLDSTRRFQLGEQGALWVRLTLPKRDPAERWFIVLDGSTVIEQATAYEPDGTGAWRTQQAGDRIPVNEWTIPDRMPLFEVASGQGEHIAWLRLASHPSALSLRAALVEESQLQMERSWTYLFVGGYLGFGMLALFLGWVHARLYADRAFLAYMAYVASMLGFQAAFTGVGGLFFWPGNAIWNNAAAPVFMLWLTGAGLWLVSEACAFSRFQPTLNRLIQTWAVFGLVYPAAYIYLDNALALTVFNTYALLSLLTSLTLCLWRWRQGDRYAGWLALTFLPVQAGSALLSLHASGLLLDIWVTPYAVLIASAVEIPVLLYILHRRAKEFTENRARLHAIDSADPLTGLPIKPIFDLRLRDAIRRARRFRHQSGMLMVELMNHGEIVTRLGQANGDRALVVAAALLSRLVRDVDTVCRVQQHRFALLIEGPRKLEHLKLLSQHIVAKGLDPGSALPDGTSLRFRVALTMLPIQRGIGAEEDERNEAEQLKSQLHQALDQQPDDAQKPVIHLGEPA